MPVEAMISRRQLLGTGRHDASAIFDAIDMPKARFITTGCFAAAADADIVDFRGRARIVCGPIAAMRARSRGHAFGAC